MCQALNDELSEAQMKMLSTPKALRAEAKAQLALLDSKIQQIHTEKAQRRSESAAAVTEEAASLGLSYSSCSGEAPMGT